MGKIKIIGSDLVDLLDDDGSFRTGYLDRQTGEILVTYEDYDGPEQREVIDKIDDNPSRYLRIESIGSRKGFRIMEKFVEALPEGADQDLLAKVLSWKKPFSNFKSALADMDDLREQWFDFQNKELQRLAKQWLDFAEVDAEFISYEEAARQRKTP